MSRPNLARLEPSAYTVLSVADPEKIATRTEQVLGELDLDHLCRLLIRSERSLSLVNRRSFAAALADVPALPNQALRPAPPFPDAVASAREDGKLLERTRQFLAQNPRALEELTPELTLALLRHFDPTMRMRPSPFTRHVVAVGSVTVIALIAAVLGIVHTQQNDAVAAKSTEAQIAQIEREQRVASVHAPQLTHYDDERALRTPQIPAKPAVAAVPVASPQVLAAAPAPAPNFHVHEVGAASAAALIPPASAKKYALLFAPPVSVKPQISHTAAASPIISSTTATVPTVPADTAKQTASLGRSQTITPNGVPVASSPTGATTVTPTGTTADANSTNAGASPQTKAAAAGIILHTILAQDPNANVEWIRASKSSEHVVTVTTRVHTAGNVSEETYQLYNSGGQLTLMNHHTSTP